MNEKQKIVLTDDEALYKMMVALINRAKEMGHGQLQFKATVMIHQGKILDISLSESVGTLKYRTTQAGT